MDANGARALKRRIEEEEPRRRAMAELGLLLDERGADSPGSANLRTASSAASRSFLSSVRALFRTSYS